MGVEYKPAWDGRPITPPSAWRAPWQVWVVVVLLGLEGLGNLFAIPRYPVAAVWLAVKVLLITGLLTGSRWVFALFLFLAGVHVLGFARSAPFVAFLNLLLLLLAASAFPRSAPPAENPARDRKGPRGDGFDPEFDV